MGNLEKQGTKSRAVRQLLLEGVRVSDIPRMIGCSIALVASVRRSLVYQGLMKPGKAGFGNRILPGEQAAIMEKLERSLNGEKLPLTRTQVDLDPQPGEPAELPSELPDDLGWLRSVRDNPSVAWSDRIRASLAVLKLEGSQQESGWEPPSGAQWQRLLADLIDSQAGEDRQGILDLLQAS